MYSIKIKSTLHSHQAVTCPTMIECLCCQDLLARYWHEFTFHGRRCCFLSTLRYVFTKKL